MADPRTFTLIGEFQDGITPELTKINNAINTFKSNMMTMTSRRGGGFSDVTSSVGKLVSAQKHLKTAIEEVGAAARSATNDLKDYKSMVGKVASAHFAMNKSTNTTGQRLKKQWEGASEGVVKYKRDLQTLGQLERAERQKANRRFSGGGTMPPSPSSPRIPSPRGGGGGDVPRPPRGGGGGGGGPGGFHMAEFGFAYTLGNALSQPIQNAVVQGFQIGVGLMTKPFEYFANRLGERMQDELSDLKAAGGFFSMAKRQESPFVKNFADAIQFTQENNKVMARLAASLPGKTQDYIEVAKRVSDSVARTVLNDRAATMKMAEQIRAGDIRTYGAKSITEMTGSDATKKTIQVLLGDLTKDTVLAGMGGRAGAGGSMGAYGLPQLSERMISQDEVSMGQMQRYSAIFSDPLIMDALQRNINKINATSKNSADRLKAIADMYKEIVTPELVERYRRTLSGVAETFNTAIFGEETGLFGLGRKMEGLGIKFNEYGQMLDKTGKVTTDLTQAAREDLAIYDLFRDILVNVGQVLAPIVENFSMIYDPLKQLGIELNKAREVTYEVLQSFNQYRKGFENFGKQFKGKDKEKFDATRDLRAALLTIGNVMAEFKVIGESDFTSLLNKLKDPNANMAQILQNMVDQFMKSDVAAKIGEFVGTVIGTVLSEVAKVTGFFSKRLASSNKLFEGLKKGFEAAGGTEAFKNIFKDVIIMIRDALFLLIPLIPIEAYLLAAAMVVIPAAVQGLGMAIASGITAGLGFLKNKLSAMLFKTVAGSKVTGDVAAAAAAGGRGGKPSAIATQKSGTPFQHGKPKGVTGAAKSAAFQAMPDRAPGFKHVALPGSGIGIGGVTGPYKAPDLRKPPTPRAKPSFSMLSKLKGKGVGIIAASMITLSTQAPALAKAGKSLLSIGKSLPLLGIAFAGLDFGLRKAEGQDPGKAAGGAIGAGVGGAIGATLGSAIPVPVVGTVVGGVLGSMIGGWLGENIAPFFADLPAKLESGWAVTKNWFLTLPEEIGGWLGKIFIKLKNWFVIELPVIGESAKANIAKLRIQISTGFNQFIANAQKTMSDPAKWMSLVNSLATGLNKAIMSINPLSLVTGGLNVGQRVLEAAKTGATVEEATGTPKEGDRRFEEGLGSFTFRNGKWVKNAALGSLGDAVSKEMKMKPPGSDLVIANSSETVIPAAGGHGMEDFVSVLRSGFATMVSAYRQAQQKQDSTLSAINQTLISNQQQTNARLSKLETKFSTPSIGGLGGGSIGGGVDAITPIAQQFGLQMTSGYRPGDPGYHGANRARDFSNGTGPTPQMMQFAQQMASSYGSSLKELIYTPLGFSIKNGQIVPPYAQGSHYNHVHVAYATGFPTMFGSQSAALDWEKRATLGNVKVSSITARQGEFGGGGGATINGGINVSVQAGDVRNPQELAAIVANEIYMAMQNVDSVFV